MTGEWEAMAEVWLGGTPSTLWRAHSDAVNGRLVAAWLDGRLGAVLKTDLFDEAVSPGLVAALAPRASSVTGVDVSPQIVAAARQRFPELTAVEADVRTLPFADASFDTVISNSTLDHFDHADEIERSLAELARVLAPGGRLLVTLDNPRNPIVAAGKALRGHGLNRAWRRVGGGAARMGLPPYYVGATLSGPALAATLEATGLVVVRTGVVVHAPRLLAVLAGSVVERRLGARGQARFSAALEACERLGRLPTRRVSGHFVAALAVRPTTSAHTSVTPGRADRHEQEPSNPDSTMALP